MTPTDRPTRATDDRATEAQIDRLMDWQARHFDPADHLGRLDYAEWSSALAAEVLEADADAATISMITMTDEEDQPTCPATRQYGPSHDRSIVGCDLIAGHDGDHRQQQAYGRGSDVDLVWTRTTIAADTTPYEG